MVLVRQFLSSPHGIEVDGLHAVTACLTSKLSAVPDMCTDLARMVALWNAGMAKAARLASFIEVSWLNSSSACRISAMERECSTHWILQCCDSSGEVLLRILPETLSRKPGIYDK